MTTSTTNLHLNRESLIDLQLHTTYSDGTWKPTQLLDYLRQEQFGLAAITDHDNTAGLAVIQQLAIEKQQPILVAVEMTTFWHGDITDLLCFGFDPLNNALNALTESVLNRQRENTREVYANLLSKGYLFPNEPDALETILAAPSPDQPHALVALLKRHGYGAPGQPSAGRIVMESGCIFAASQPAEVVDAAHRSGAVCVIAHPGRDDGFVTFTPELLDEFRREAPVDGIEAYYPLHKPEQVEMFRAYAQQHGLLISAGSDSHGPEKQRPIPYRAELCRELLERVGIRVEA